jgi:hypothetical protein
MGCSSSSSFHALSHAHPVDDNRFAIRTSDKKSDDQPSCSMISTKNLVPVAVDSVMSKDEKEKESKSEEQHELDMAKVLCADQNAKSYCRAMLKFYDTQTHLLGENHPDSIKTREELKAYVKQQNTKILKLIGEEISTVEQRIDFLNVIKSLEKHFQIEFWEWLEFGIASKETDRGTCVRIALYIYDIQPLVKDWAAMFKKLIFNRHFWDIEIFCTETEKYYLFLVPFALAKRWLSWSCACEQNTTLATLEMQWRIIDITCQQMALFSQKSLAFSEHKTDSWDLRPFIDDMICVFSQLPNNHKYWAPLLTHIGYVCGRARMFDKAAEYLRLAFLHYVRHYDAEQVFKKETIKAMEMYAQALVNTDREEDGLLAEVISKEHEILVQEKGNTILAKRNRKMALKQHELLLTHQVQAAHQVLHDKQQEED